MLFFFKLYALFVGFAILGVIILGAVVYIANDLNKSI